MKKFPVTVIDRQQIIYSGEVVAVSSKNAKGPFDILEDHTNFICSVQEYLILYKTMKDKKNLPISFGVMHVKDQQAKVFVGL